MLNDLKNNYAETIAKLNSKEKQAKGKQKRFLNALTKAIQERQERRFGKE